MKKRSFWRDNGLSLAMFGCFFLFVIGQTFAGWKDHNNEQALHGAPPDSLGSYVTSGDFYEALFENWESEFLQMGAYIVLTAYLFQRGSSESKNPDEEGSADEDPVSKKDEPDVPGPVKSGGWRLRVYQHSLSGAFFAFFFLSFVGHAIGGAHAYSDELREYGKPPVSTWQYLESARFWFESLQNWQSEFLAVGAIVVLSIYLREQGSPESKPVAAAHWKTGTD